MRITSFYAKNFLSFDEFGLDDLDPHFNIIVGPNGAGKTNLVRAVETAFDVATAPHRGYQARRLWQQSERLGSPTRGFTVRIGLEMTTEREKNLIAAFIGSVLATTPVTLDTRRESPEDRGKYYKWIHDQITPDKCECLHKGVLEVAFSGKPENQWEISYTFEHGKERYTWSLETRQGRNGIVNSENRGSQQQVGKQLAVVIGSLAQERVFDEASFKPFEFASLLPSSGEYVYEFEVRPTSDAQGCPGPLRHFGELFNVDVAATTAQYPALFLFSSLILQTVVVTQNIRASYQTEYSSQEISQNIHTFDLGKGTWVPLYLFRLKNGTREQRAIYERVCETFCELADQKLDIRIDFVSSEESQEQKSEGTRFTIEPAVLPKAGDIPVRLAGAGIVEALTLSTLIALSGGKIILLDEPALNLHPIMQKRVLGQLQKNNSQYFAITHSPYLIPTNSAEDLPHVLRFDLRDQTTFCSRLSQEQINKVSSKEETTLVRELTRAVDVPSLLFASGVFLAEGDTELGTLPLWFSLSPTANESGGPMERNLVLISVGGDRNFKVYVSFLAAFGIPWAIICDGPILKEASILSQLGVNNSEIAPPVSFEEVKQLCKKYGVFTLVDSFNQEFDDLPYIRPHRTQAKKAVGSSKVRQGRYIAQNESCPPEVDTLYREILDYLGVRSSA